MECCRIRVLVTARRGDASFAPSLIAVLYALGCPGCSRSCFSPHPPHPPPPPPLTFIPPPPPPPFPFLSPQFCSAPIPPPRYRAPCLSVHILMSWSQPCTHWTGGSSGQDGGGEGAGDQSSLHTPGPPLESDTVRPGPCFACCAPLLGTADIAGRPAVKAAVTSG